MDIDTRTDVYALGRDALRIAHRLAAVDAKQFQRGAILEMLRMVREVEPPRPSTRLSTAEALPSIAANRSIEPARLAKLLQGELDWVVMKALEKDRTRRYETANGFARDIQRYLADEVVEARPPSRGYRLKKFVKRNKGQVIAASLVLLDVGRRDRRHTVWEWRRARRAQKAEAEQRGSKADDQRRARRSRRETKARDEAAKTQAINDFLTQDLLTQAEPANNAVEDEVTLLEVLDRAAEKVGTRFADQPELERSLRRRSPRPITAWRPGRRPNRNGGPCSRRRGSATRSRPKPTTLRAFLRTSSPTAVDGTPRSWRWPRRPPGDSNAHSAPTTPHTLTRSTTSPWRTGTPASSPRRSPCSSASATPRSPSSAPTTPTPWPRSTTSPGRTRPPAGSPRRSPCSSASATPRSPSSAPTTPTP